MNVARRLIEKVNEATHDVWIVHTPSGMRQRVGGVDSADAAIAKWAARCSYKTLEKAKAAGATATLIPALTQDRQGQRNAEKHGRWFNAPGKGRSVLQRLIKQKAGSKTVEAGPGRPKTGRLFQLSPQDMTLLNQAGYSSEDAERIRTLGTQISAGQGSIGIHGGSYAYWPKNWNLTTWMASDGSQFRTSLVGLLLNDVDEGVLDTVLNSRDTEFSVLVHARTTSRKDDEMDQESHEERMMRGESVEKAADKLVKNLIEGPPRPGKTDEYGHVWKWRQGIIPQCSRCGKYADTSGAKAPCTPTGKINTDAKIRRRFSPVRGFMA